MLLGLNSSCTPSGSGQQAEIGKIIDKYTLLEDVEKQQQEQKQALVEFDNLFFSTLPNLPTYLPVLKKYLHFLRTNSGIVSFLTSLLKGRFLVFSQ